MSNKPTPKKPKKIAVKVQDLKPKKDAKGGGASAQGTDWNFRKL